MSISDVDTSSSEPAAPATSYVCRRSKNKEVAILGKERDKLISGVSKTDNWPLRKRRLIQEHFQPFVKFIHDIPLESMSEV
jgi:hypothetical protein